MRVFFSFIRLNWFELNKYSRLFCLLMAKKKLSTVLKTYRTGTIYRIQIIFSNWLLQRWTSAEWYPFCEYHRFNTQLPCHRFFVNNWTLNSDVKWALVQKMINYKKSWENCEVFAAILPQSRYNRKIILITASKVSQWFRTIISFFHTLKSRDTRVFYTLNLMLWVE